MAAAGSGVPFDGDWYRLTVIPHIGSPSVLGAGPFLRVFLCWRVSCGFLMPTGGGGRTRRMASRIIVAWLPFACEGWGRCVVVADDMGWMGGDDLRLLADVPFLSARYRRGGGSYHGRATRLGEGRDNERGTTNEEQIRRQK